MVSNRKSPDEQPSTPSQEPVTVGDVVEMLFDLRGQEIHIDPRAEDERKLEVVSRLVEVTHQVREDEIAKAEAGEERDPEEMRILGEQLIDLTAKREELRQELQEQPPEQP